jgi:hypothetical protein
MELVEKNGRIYGIISKTTERLLMLGEIKYKNAILDFRTFVIMWKIIGEITIVRKGEMI